jgi:hypothetical protein
VGTVALFASPGFFGCPQVSECGCLPGNRLF